MFRKFEETMISKIRNDAEVRIPGAISQGLDFERYFKEFRVGLNMMVIQTILGLDYHTNKKGAIKLRFKHRIITPEGLAKIGMILDRFVKEVEAPFLAQHVGEQDADEDDISIPEELLTEELPELTKLNGKAIQQWVMGSADSPEALRTRFITGSHLVYLFAMAKKIKNRKILNTCLIVGGITLLLVGGGVTALVLTKKSNSGSGDEMPEAIEIDDIPVVDIEDVPEVDMGAMHALMM